MRTNNQYGFNEEQLLNREWRPSAVSRAARDPGSDYGNSYGGGTYGSPGSDPGSADHRGKGPRNYKRSDERITEAVCERLRDDDHLDATNIDVQVSNGEVVLGGTADSREAKRRAADLAEHTSGVGHVENRIRVAPEGSAGSSGGNAS